MYYDNEEFEQKIDGYKIPRGGKRPAESDGPFVGPPKYEKDNSRDKYADWKQDGSKQRSPNKGYNSRKSNNDYMTGANSAPLGQNARSNAP